MSRLRTAVCLCTATLSTAALAAAVAEAATTKYSASLSGAQEVPKNGSKATGKATLTVTGKKLCYVMTSTNLGEVPQAAHIHKGAKGKSGPVFIALFTSPKALKNGKLSGCVNTTTAKLSPISVNPGVFYFNVHTKKYPAGAMRGQLKKA